MSKYTTEIRYICEQAVGLDVSKGFNDVESIISGARNKIFNFDYPIFNEDYRSVLETKILRHFYTREIGLETVGLWKLKLSTKLNEIMPYYNKLYESELLEFNPLYSTDINRTHTKNDDGTKNEQGITTDTSNGTSNTTSNDLNWNYYNDTPQGGIENIEDLSYLTNATKNTDNQTSNNTITSNGTSNTTRGEQYNTTESFIEHIYGYSGKDISNMLKEFRQTFLNIDMMIIDDLEELFMQVW